MRDGAEAAASAGGMAVNCLPGWLHWTPAAAGPRLAVFALLPVLVLALIGYASSRTLRAYELWTLPPGYFGQRWLTELARRLSVPGAEPRWRNVRRPSDYIGSYNFRDPMDPPNRSVRRPG